MDRLVVALVLLALVPLSHAPAGLRVSPQGWTNQPQFVVQWEDPGFSPTAVCAKFWEPPSGPEDHDVRVPYDPGGLTLTAPSEGDIPVYVWFEEGNRSYWREYGVVHLRYDATAPSVEAEALLPSGYVTSLDVTIRVRAEDPLSGPARMRVWEEGMNGTWTQYADTATVRISPREGLHRIIVQVSDAAGNLATAYLELVADFTPPDLEVDVVGASPLGDLWATPNGTVELRPSAFDGVSGVDRILLSQDPDFSAYVEVVGGVTVTLPNPGRNTFYLMAVNGAGIPSRPLELVIYRDIQPPVLTILEYSRVLLGDSDPWLRVAALDDLEVPWLVVNGEKMPYGENMSLDVNWGHGVHSITVVALDAVGHSSNPCVVEVYVFSERPKLELSYRNVTTEAYLRLSLRVLGDLGTPLLVHVGNDTYPYSGNLTVPLEPEPGPHLLRIWVEDDLGVASEETLVRVYLDLVPPYSWLRVDGARVQVNATDDSWVVCIRLYELEDGWHLLSVLAPGEGVELAPGVHTLATIAVDAAGRVEPWGDGKPVKVLVDLSPPRSSLSAALLDNGTVKLEVNATDDTGIDTILIQVREGDWRTIATNTTVFYYRPGGKGKILFRSLVRDLSGKWEEKEGYDAYVRVGGTSIRRLLPLVLVPLLLYFLGPRVLSIIRSIRR